MLYYFTKGKNATEMQKKHAHPHELGPGDLGGGQARTEGATEGGL